jgi:DnaJ family protein C protein 17
MAPNDELKSYATSTFDFYALLSLPTNFSQKELDRARRLTSFKYHPDKVGDDASAREKLHLTNVGYELLNDPSLRALYDNARSARERKKASEVHLEAGRRKLKEDLEARELAGRRAADDIPTPVNKLSETEQRLRWLAEDGKRRRLELQARRAREHQLETENEQQQSEAARLGVTTTTSSGLDEDVPELDRSIKLTFPRTANMPQPTPDLLKGLMQAYGLVDSAFLVKDKRGKTIDGKARVMQGTAYVVFLQQSGALAAINGWQAHAQHATDYGRFWSSVDSLTWAGGEEPEGLRDASNMGKPVALQRAPLTASSGGAFTKNPFVAGPDDNISLEETALSRLQEAASRQVPPAA